MKVRHNDGDRQAASCGRGEAMFYFNNFFLTLGLPKAERGIPVTQPFSSLRLQTFAVDHTFEGAVPSGLCRLYVSDLRERCSSGAFLASFL
ncbi:hypothetical protein L1987_85177 [Smallanthus sonchifolius]|uniref:Uncharacterized protein n=1 Tax=Smallanthus sonchifolius TaxID=185202 RepID=A0ACB8XV98_9ASTR|nr:hypothetical protein L1987_85177 [Smallanthus sonchifolius]